MHFPVNTDRKRPKTPEELIEYVEWALPRARQLGCMITKPEARSIGFMHAAFMLAQARAADELAKQKAEAEAAPTRAETVQADMAEAMQLDDTLLPVVS